MSTQWIVNVGNAIHGPYSLDALRAFYALGHLSSQCLLRTGRFGRWKLAGNVIDLFDRPSPPPLAEQAPSRHEPNGSPDARGKWAKPQPLRGTAQNDGVREQILYKHPQVMFAHNPFGFLLSCLLIPFGVGLLILILWRIKTFRTRLIVTNCRTTLRQGLLRKDMNDVFHVDVRNVQVRQTFFQRLMGTGEVLISSSAQGTVEIHVTDIPDPCHVRALIDQYRR